ncbi:MAG TPA: GWxTD domain-containing protein [Gemmatimonadales bacterium]|jgi:GWxTD domain-containing protein|nr:GWxTD domain-containing protein [Gemmatimonadales bacterium]
MYHSVLTLAALLSVWSASPVHAQDSLQMRVVRYYRPEASQTLVKVFVSVPYALLQAPTSGTGDGSMVYTVSAQVQDSTGLALLAEPWTWSKRVPARAKVLGASGLELMEFPVVAGRYTMQVTVTDSVSGRSAKAQAPVIGYASAPAASDLLLSPAMRTAGDGDSVPQPGEMRRGNTIVVPAVELRLTPVRTKVYYLLEAYSGKTEEVSGTMQVSVVDTSGKSLFRTAASAVPVPVGGGTLQGQLDLDGLPPGNYEFVVSLDVDGQRVERRAPFEMMSMQEMLARDSARGGAPGAPASTVQGSDEAYFAAMDEAQLDSAVAPLILIAKQSELRTYSQLSVNAKRRFLVSFWGKLDQQPETPVNETRQRFYQAIAYADQAFRVGRGTQEPGWRTDRGRIYTKYGAASDQLNRVPTGFAPAYEVWRYTRGRPRYYVFADRNGFGAYKLIFTNDLTETGVPTWRDILGAAAVQDISQYLGIDFTGGSAAPF